MSLLMSSKTVKSRVPEIDTLHFRMKLTPIPFASKKLHALLLDSSNQYDSKMKVANLTPSYILVLARPVLVQHISNSLGSTSGKELRSDASWDTAWGRGEIHHRTGVSSQYPDRPDRKPKRIIRNFLEIMVFDGVFFLNPSLNPCHTWFLWVSGWHVSINSLESRQVRRNQVVAPTRSLPPKPQEAQPLALHQKYHSTWVSCLQNATNPSRLPSLKKNI